MKKRSLLIGAVAIGLLLIGGRTLAMSMEAQQAADEAAKEAAEQQRFAIEVRLEESRSAFDASLEAAIREKLNMVQAVYAEKKAEEIRANTIFVGKRGAKVYAEANTGADKVSSLPVGDPLYIKERIQDEQGVDTWYAVQYDYEDEKPLGWIQAKRAVALRVELIDKPYDGVDYDHIRPTANYESNPRVQVKGIYLTGHTMTNSRLDDLIALADRTAINAFVIDVKDDNGTMLFPTEAAEKYSPKANQKSYFKAGEVEAVIEKLKEHNIYMIARIVTFKSPKYAVAHTDRAIVYKNSGSLFKSGDGIIWASPHDRDLWDYNVSVAKEAAAKGFNEIQFDYVRFPATGSKLDKQLDFRNPEGHNKAQTIHNFLEYAYDILSKEEVYVSADVFGWAATSIGDVGIGQHWESLTHVVDYMSPMMYPSHYGPGIYGLSVPDAFPYETIDAGIQDALERDKNVETPSQLRPWIQDFTATWVKGYIRYGDKEVEAQIRALEDNGVGEYLIWNPINRYSEGGIR